ncbi:MAG: YARHG domain-containing protein, partial [Mogibacterium sp.]|nr:YARHG domain-containing protein [Mogibacterium sp.]
KTETTGSASADAGEEAYSGDETESSGTEAEDTSVSDAQQQEPQEETAEAVPAVTPEENTQESAQESMSFEDACMVCIDRRITDEDIDAIYSTAPSGLPETPIQMAINYVYAWHGYHFKTDEIRVYFQNLDWYSDQGKSIDQVNAEMNAVQKDNVKKLVELR